MFPLTQTILVADERPLFRDLISVFLARSGARVVTVSTGEEALTWLTQKSADLLIAAFDLPGIDGADLAQKLRQSERFSLLPILMMIPADRADKAARSLRAGANDLLVQPIERAPLIAAVHHFLLHGIRGGLPRVEVRLPIQVQSPLVRSHGLTQNLSRGGLKVQTSCPFAPRSEVHVRLQLPGHAEPLRPLAQVVWARSLGAQPTTEMGLRFLEIDGSALRSLDHFIVDNSQIDLRPLPLPGVRASRSGPRTRPPPPS